MSSIDYDTIKAMSDYGWTKPFARQYVLERVYGGRSHGSAIRKAMMSSWVQDRDKPQRLK